MKSYQMKCFVNRKALWNPSAFVTYIYRGDRVLLNIDNTTFGISDEIAMYHIAVSSIFAPAYVTSGLCSISSCIF